MTLNTMHTPASKLSDPSRTARIALVATMLAASYLDFFGYRAQGYLDPAFFNDRLSGQGPAPDQYRVGIVWLAHFLVVHFHIALTMAVASIDTVSGLVAVLVLFSVLQRTDVYREAATAGRWFGAMVFVLLVQWFLAWLLWLQKPETLPAAMLVALLLWLWQATPPASGWAWKATLCVALSVLLATFRADVACLLNLGLFIFVLAGRQRRLSLPYYAAVVTSLAGSLFAIALQIYLMHEVYPHANYGRVKIWQFRPNIMHASRWPPFVLFLLPLLWMLAQIVRRRFAKDAAGMAFLAGAILFGALWFTIGKIDEVRIFLPFALALAPLTAQMAVLLVHSVVGDDPAISAPQN